MTPSTINLMITLGIIILCITPAQSVILMLGGKSIFTKANKDPNSVYIPILNLFTLLEIVEMSTFWGILFFMPVTNLVVFTLIALRLKKLFSLTTGFTIGLILFPIMFYPLFAISDKQYKLSDEQYFKALDNAKADNLNLLMTDEEIKSINKVEVEEEKVDSIFKSDIDLMEEVEPYHATEVTAAGYEKIKNTDFENILEPIDIAPQLEPVVEEETKENNKKFTSELEKPEEVEIVDL